jgi:hypothetical protein
MAVPADGAITLQSILYFLPSNASVFVSDMIPALAVEYWVYRWSAGVKERRGYHTLA